MPPKTVRVAAITGSTLIALLLTGSLRNAASSPINFLSFEESEIKVLASDARTLVAEGRYVDARAAFRTIAERAQKSGLARAAAMNWNNAGVCSLYSQQFRDAKADFTKAKAGAEASSQYVPLAYTLNSLASLYLLTGQPENAIRVAQEALNGPAGRADPVMRAKLLYNVAVGYMDLDRFESALPYCREAINGFLDQKDLESAARAWAGFGTEAVRANRLEEAEPALSEGLRLVRTHRLNLSAFVLTGLARLKSGQGDNRSALALFDAAFAAPPGITPVHMIYAYRGQFRLKTGDVRGALADFRVARRLVTEMRADMVPADQDRVALEKGLSLIYDGLVNGGNLLARETGDPSFLEETFEAAEQDRLWSLRALVPSPNDWRTRLPEHYWEVLTRYQTLERSALSKSTATLEGRISALRLELQQMEADAASNSGAGRERETSSLAHVKRILDDDTVLLSFHVSKSDSWVWAIDRQHVDVYPVPPSQVLQSEIAEFHAALRRGTPASAISARLYKDLFGMIPERYLGRKHWRLELSGPLFDLPFAALVMQESASGPVYLVEHADLQSVPSALLAERGGIPADGEFLGISDPVYNPADARYRGNKTKPEFLLARLPNTSDEVQACARAWNSPHPQLLTGVDARLATVRTAVESKPAIVHFATHVVAGTGDFRSGLIALSLSPQGEMDLLGPREIVARSVSVRLVVLDGCHSAQAEALPGAGLMGLTRAWIGAGAMAVLATQWDIPDDSASALMTSFYRALRASPQGGPADALRAAQLNALKSPQARRNPAMWAGYFLQSRML